MRPKSTLTRNQLRHKSEALRSFICSDCAMPACSVKGCATCKCCRDLDCAGEERCELKPVPLSEKSYSTNLAEKLSFQCRLCRLSCVVCGDRNRSKFSASMLHSAGVSTHTLLGLHQLSLYSVKLSDLLRLQEPVL